MIVHQNPVGGFERVLKAFKASLKITGERLGNRPVSLEIMRMKLFDVGDHRRHQRHRFPPGILMNVLQVQFGFDPADPGAKVPERALNLLRFFRRQE